MTIEHGRIKEQIIETGKQNTSSLISNNPKGGRYVTGIEG
jgi:hypothetical protein